VDMLQSLADPDGAFAKDLMLEVQRVWRLKRAAWQSGGRSKATVKVAALGATYGLNTEPNGWLDVLVGSIYLACLESPPHEAVCNVLAQMPPGAAALKPIACDRHGQTSLF